MVIFSALCQDFAGTNKHYWQDIVFPVTTMVPAVHKHLYPGAEKIWA
jgi:hypothetical protein